MAGLNDPLTQLDYGEAIARGPQSVTQQTGLAGLAAPMSTDIARARQGSLQRLQDLGNVQLAKPPAPAAPPRVLAISRSTGNIWANGKLFSLDDAQGAIESEQFLGGPPQPAPAAVATDWEPLSEEAYAQYIGQIKDPSLTTLAAKGFGTGIDTSQMLAGYGLQFLGATETGQGIVRQQLEDIRKNAPYQRTLEDIPERGVVEWFVANLAQQGPNLVESAVTAAIGAAAGAAAGGGANPFTAAGGAITSMVGKQAFKQAVLTAAKKYAAGEALDAAESKLLREAAGITVAARKELFDKIGTVAVDSAGVARTFTADDAAKALLGPAASRVAAGGAAQAQIGGAALATGLQNYATGVSEMYGESIEGGTPDRALAALAGVPYAAAETLPEYLAALRLFKGLGLKAAKAGARGGRAGTIATNVGIGTGAGAILEGTTEAFQETLGIGMNADVDIDSPEGISRLLNAFAAGAAIGGFIGGASSLNTGKATDLLSAGTKPAEQGGTTLTGEVMPPTPGGAPALPAPAAGPAAALPPPATPPGAPPSGVSGVGFAQPQVGAAPAAQALPPATTIYAGAPAPTPALTGPAPQPPAPQPPAVIPMGGPERFGSALEQAAAGGLPQAAPTGPLANRLQQQAADARARAVQAQLEATSGSALARIGRGEAIGGIPPVAPAQQLELPLAAPELQVTAEIPADPREVRVMYERMVQEQTKRQDLLRNKTKLAAYAKKRGLKSAEMRRLLTDNFEAAQPVVAELERRIASPEFAAQEAANKQAASKIKFKEISPAVTQTAEPALQVGEAAPAPAVTPHDTFIEEFDDARLNDANKLQLRAIVKRAVKAGVLTERDTKELDIAFKDRDMTADDIAPLASSLIQQNKEQASAAQVRQVEQGRQLKRPKDRGRLAKGREDRNLKAQKQEAGGAPSGGNRLKQGKAAQAEQPGAVKPTKAVVTQIDREMWDTFFDDGGAGYDALPDKGKADWRKLVVRGDITQAEADAFQAKYAKPPSPKAGGAAAAPSKKAEEPGTAVTVVEPKKPVEDVEAKRKAAKVAAEQAEIEALASRALSDQAEVEAMIVAYNEAEPGSVESDDALMALIEYANDNSIGRGARTRAQDYLAYEVDENDIKLAERKLSGEVDQDTLDFNTITTALEQYNNGEIKLVPKIVGALVSAWKRIKSKKMKYGLYPLDDYIKGGPQFFNIVKGKVTPKGDGKYSLSQFDNPENPVSAGRIKLIINKFTSKLAVKPKVYVFRNQADLKASDPKLYTKMRAGRAAADFDTAPAAGYSLNDTVIIFSDRIGSEDHLAFVLAHETLGHFGFRGLMGNNDFNILMEKLYDSDPRVKVAADAAMRATGMGKAEAVEEYLADYAGRLDVRLLSRFWKGVKSTLNRFGIKFGDEATRYLLDQSKRYVRTGQKSGAFETSSILSRLWAVESAQMGRFSMVGISDDNERAAQALRHGANLFPMSLQEAAGRMKDFGGSWDKFKEKFFSLMNYQALRNPGLYEFEKLMDETRQREQYIHNKYNERLTGLLYKNEAYKDTVSRMLLIGRAVSVYRLVQNPLSPADRKKTLFSVGPDGSLVRNTKAIEDFIERGILTFDELRTGGTYTREDIDERGNTVKREVSFEGIQGLTQEQYDDYVMARRTVADVELELLEAKYANALHTERVSRKAISRLLKSANLEGDAAKLVDKTLKKYKEIYVSGYTVDARGNITPGVDQINLADDFLAAVNRALISADAKNDPDVRAFFDQQRQADDFIANLEAFRADRKVPDGELTFLFQNEMKRIILDDVSLGVEEDRAKRSMAAGYVPVIRDKAFEMRLEAVDEKGNPVRLHEEHKKLLVYSQFDSASLAKQNADIITAELGDTTYEALVMQDDGSYKTQPVRLRVKYGEALSQVTADPALNLDEFMHGLRLFKINLTPDKMTKIIQTLTEAGDPIRKRLEFSNTPGYDKSTGIFAMARHIQMRAATIAKTVTRPRTRDLMDLGNEDSYDLWAGNRKGIFDLHDRWSKATNPDLKREYRQLLNHALYMFTETYPEAKGWDGSKAGFDAIKGKIQEFNYNRFYNQAQRTLDFLESNQLVSESNFGAGRTVAALRAATSIFQLGGSIAQGVMNMTSPYTNWMPYMMSHNSRNGFGGGFGAGMVVSEYHKALTQVGAPGVALSKYNSAEYYEELVNNPTELAASGLTRDEAMFLALEIREGKLIPAQANALLGTARAGISNPLVLRGIDVFMAPFNRTEQASRRAAGLAAFRLAMRRNGGDADAARDFAIQSLDLTLGEYSVLNRPPAWRDGIQSFLYMYKVYPTTTIQLFRRLDKKGQMIMLGSLWLVAGVTGFPFAEDIEDLVDTISQLLGLQMGSVRAEFAKTIDSVAPGLSPAILKGFVNGYLGVPADVAGRFSQGDFLPGTGILLAGATVAEEFKDIAGPMPSMAIGLATMARDLIATPFSERQTLADTLRGAPVTALRMFSDAYTYWDNGAVVDKRGYVITPDMNAGTIITRLLGFYPEAAAKEYEAIRVAKRIGNYQKDVVASYRYAWVKAMQTGNRAYARQIEQSVAEWNKGAKGTALEIKDFVRNSQRALKEARLSATQRTLRSTSTAGREDTARIMDLLIQ